MARFQKLDLDKQEEIKIRLRDEFDKIVANYTITRDSENYDKLFKRSFRNANIKIYSTKPHEFHA